MKLPRSLSPFLWLVLLAGCVGSVSEEARPCPCTQGWTCCEQTRQCLPDGDTCPGKPDTGNPPDTVPPLPPVLSAALPGSPTASATATLDGTSEPGATITLFQASDCAGPPEGTGTADAAGSFRVSVPLRPNTLNTFYGRATDAAGNASNCSLRALSLLQDGLAPEPPVLEGVTPTSPSNASRNPVLSGTAEPGTTVQLFSDAACLAALPFSATTDAAGAFRVWASVGDNTTTVFHARALDVAGNASPCSRAAVGYTHDAVGPARPFLTGPAYTNQPEPEATGGAEPLARVRLYAQADCQGAPVSEGSATAAGTFALRFTAARNAPTTLSARALDAAGNGSECSASSISTHDDLAPGKPWNLSLSSSSPGRELRPLLSGSAAPGATVRVYREDSACGSQPLVTTTASEGGRFTVQVEAEPNSWTWFNVSVVDAAGNASPCSPYEYVEYRHDSEPPSPPRLLAASEPSPSTAGGLLTLHAEGEYQATLRFYADAACAGPLLGTGKEGTPAPWSGSQFTSPRLTPLEGTTHYYATATDKAGNTSACSPTGHAHTRVKERGWGPLEALTGVEPTAFALGDGGHAVVAWVKLGTNTMTASRYTPGEGWSAPEPLMEMSHPVPDAPTVAVDAAGHAFVAWSVGGSGALVSTVRRFVPGQGWQPAEGLRTDATVSAGTPSIAFDAGGNAFALWYESRPGEPGAFVRVSRFTPEGGWEAPVALSPRPVESTWRRDLVVAANGAAWAFWPERRDGVLGWWGRRYTPGEGWGAEEPLLGDEQLWSLGSLAMDGAGRLMVTYTRWVSDTQSHVFVRQHVPGQGWSESRQLSVPNTFQGRYARPVLAVNARGEAVALWLWKSPYAWNDELWGSRFTPEEGWGEATTLMGERGSLIDADPRVSLDDTGAARVGWVQSFAPHSGASYSSGISQTPWTARFEPGAGWKEAELLADTPGSGYTFHLKMNARGETVALWRYSPAQGPSVTLTRAFR